MPTVSCPSCGRALEVDPTYRDWTVRCPHCATEFVPAEASPAAFEADARPRRERYDPPDGGYDRPPRRARPRRDDPRRPERDREYAAEAVYAPGLWLELCGWVGAVVLMGGAVFWVLMAAEMKNNPNVNGNANGDDEVGPMLFAVVSAVCAIPYAVVMIVGGRKMRNLSGYGWALTACIVGVSSVVLMCNACVFALVPVVFGIWGVSVLNNPAVQRAFEANREGRVRPREWEDPA